MFSLWAALCGLARGWRSEEHFALDRETSPPKPFTFKQSHYLSQQASDFIILSLAGEQSASCLEQTGALEVNTARSSVRPLKSACRLFLCDLWPEVLHKQREARLTLMLISCNKSCHRELYNKTIRTRWWWWWMQTAARQNLEAQRKTRLSSSTFNDN